MFLENNKLQTWDPVCIESSYSFFWMFQNFIHLSPEPPPLAKIELLWGFHAKALTAALWEVNLQIGVLEQTLHIKSLLSFPPEANFCSSGDHFKPQT